MSSRSKKKRQMARRQNTQPAPDSPSFPNPDIQDRVTIAAGRYFSGPVPDPDTLRAYSEIVPNGAERIFKNWEDQSEHRRSMERKEMVLRYLGWGSSTAIVGVSLYFGWDLTREGMSTAGLVSLLNAAGWIAGMFLLGRARRQQR